MIRRASATVNRAAALALWGLGAGAAGAAAQDCPLTVTEPFTPPADAAAPGAPRIRSIRFEGQRAVGAAALGRRMEMKPARFWRSSRRSVYSEAAWAADHRRLCDLLREEGYVTAAVGPPEVQRLAALTGASAEVTLRIPVREGPRYRAGSVDVAGVPAVETEAARGAIEPGSVYRHGDLVAALDEMRLAAGRRGHATWSAAITMDPQPGAAVVDVKVRVDEGPPWLVGRIAFQGAPGTRDETLRR